MQEILYLSGTVPDDRYTFVLREVEALLKEGIRVSFVAIKPERNYQNQQGKPQVFVSGTNPLLWLILPLVNLFRYKKSLIFSGNFFKILSGADYRKTHFLRVLGGMFFLESALNKTYKSGVQFKHIHSHHLFASSLFTPGVAASMNLPYSISVHTLSHYYTPVFLHTLMQKARFTRFVTRETLDHFQTAKPAHPVYLPNAVDTKVRTGRGMKMRTENQVFSILGIGKYLDKKGFDILIRSCRILSDKKVNYQCKIFGEGPEQANLNKLIASLQIEDQVKLQPFVPFEQLIPEFEKADVLAVPSRTPRHSTRDGLPTVILEAMALGVPVIASDFAGISDAVIHEKTGLLIEPDDAEKLAEALDYLRTRPSVAEGLVQQAAAWVREQYDLDTNIHQLALLFTHPN